MSSFTLSRVWSNDQATLGLLYVGDDKGIRMLCHTLEDPHQNTKDPKHTPVSYTHLTLPTKA